MKVAANSAKRLEQLSARLVSVTRRNKSIRLLRKAKKQCFDVSEVEALRPGVAEEVLRAVLTHKRATLLTQREAPASAPLDLGEPPPEGESPDRARARLFQKLDSNLVQLSRNAASIEAETGAMDLYFGYPWITGNCDDPEGTYLQAPLLLYPVQITVERRPRLTWSVAPRDDAEPILNEVLVLALSQYHGTELGESFIEEAEAAGVDRELVTDPAALVRWFHEKLAGLGLRMRAPEERLSALPEYKADEVPRESGGFSVRSHATLGYFPQADSALRYDYGALIEKRGALPEVVARLLDSAAHVEPEPDGFVRSMDEVPERETSWIVPSDASQEAAMLRSRAEKCLVIHGPPGTGKSQVICNLIADALSRDERVLVCCQKRAALDVVYQRLEKHGLGRHVALVHDHANDRHKLYADIARCLEAAEADDARLDAEGSDLAASIDEATSQLRALASELHRIRRCGLSARRLYAMAPAGDAPDVELARMAGALDAPQLERFCEALERLRALHARMDEHAEAWSRRRSFAQLSFNDRRVIDEALACVARAAEALGQAVEGVPRPSAEPAAEGEACEAMARALRTYDERRASLFRIFSGAFRSARDAARPYLAAHGIEDATEPVLAHATKLERLSEAFRALSGAVEGLEPYLLDEARADLLATASASPDEARREAEALREGLAAFDTLQAIDDITAGLRDVELEAYARLRATPGDWAERFRRSIICGWLEEVEAESRGLRRVATGEVGDLRQRFRAELERRRELNARRLALRLARRATEARFEPGREVDGRHSADKPWRDLRHQVTKKRRLWSIRKLVHDLRWPLMEVMPCWLVSPETLSAAFPLEEGLFDLAIFDEASQMAVQYALPAIHRSRRVVIAGDEQQLRPFDLFGALGIDGDDDATPDDDEDKAATESESILTLAKARFPEEMLACHYRSKFEELIEFSNQGFYQGRLITAPAAEGLALAPIEWRKVTGRWERRCNAPEAAAVLDLVAELLKEDPRRSVGVITFNNTQQAEILDQMDRGAGSDPELAALIAKAVNPESGNRDDALFVKNIENVQGDERDVIIFSIGYAPDASGRVYNRFGSLNKEGGDNRLNVAVSRAKERIVVVSSIEPEQLDVAGSKNRGPRLLRDYLAYAKAVSRRESEERDAVLRSVNPALDVNLGVARAPFESPLEEQIHDALTRRGLGLVPQVGVSGYRIDFGVVDPKDPTRYLLGIECDGATYHSAASARERDVYRQRFLESRGWTIHRVWSRNWWRNRDAEVEEIVRRVDALAR
jgi:very-short-patch-repair endonuclease